MIDTGLTAYEQRALIAMVVDAIPLDAFAARLGGRRGAIGKAVLDVRRTIRRELAAHAP